MDRLQIIAELEKSPEVDVLIIGGGINGAGTFLDHALNGIKVLLIDRGDFCSGASSASSHMAHGGIRYLENGEFRLVREAVAERNRMIENSPHMVKPLPTVIPIFKLFSGLLNAPLKFLNLLDKPSERGGLVIKIGLLLYDSFTYKQKTVPRHKFFGKTETLKQFPRINKDVKYSALYYDGQILSPERLNIEIILEGEKASGNAMALNYVSFEAFFGGETWLNDQVESKQIKIKPRIIINAAGPWIDIVNQRLGLKTKYIGGTKGSHIIVDNKDLRQAIADNEIFFENKDGRIVLLFPFFDKVIIGTSDLPISHPDEAVCTPEEEEYFLELVKRIYPDIQITREQIVFRFSGVRPLEYQQAKTTGQITRDHCIKVDHCGKTKVLSLVGGKWTSYRAFAEQVTDSVLVELGKDRSRSTETYKIGGGKNYPKNNSHLDNYLRYFSSKYGISAEAASNLFVNYGTLAEELLSSKKSKQTYPVESLKDTFVQELEFLTRNEKVVHLDDLLLRRTTIGWLGKINQEVIKEVSLLVGKALKWSTKQKQKEIERLKELLFEKNGLNLN